MSQYQKIKAQFLDQLQPDDFRNPSSFNVAEKIIDQLNKSCFEKSLSNKAIDEFVSKAVFHLFRKDSQAAARAIEIAKIYLQENSNL